METYQIVGGAALILWLISFIGIVLGFSGLIRLEKVFPIIACGLIGSLFLLLFSEILRRLTSA